MSKVKFKIPNSERLSKSVYSIIKHLKKEYRNNIFVELPKELIEEIISGEFEAVKQRLDEELDKKNNLKKLEKFKARIENYWKPLNNLFFEHLEKITGFKPESKEYVAYPTEIIRGMYTLKNEVFINPSRTIEREGYILAEELLHIHYWEVFKKTVKNTKIPWRINKAVWEISETIPEFILTDDLFKQFGWGKNLDRSYPFIKERKEELQPIWDSKKSFKDFMIKSHEKLNHNNL